MNPERYRPELPAIPYRMLHLAVHRGYPVPWFVYMPLPGEKRYGSYEPDFRVIDSDKRNWAVRDKLCWVCGRVLGRGFAFVIGPMCAVNRVSSEPPSHIECADFSARACPFLSRPDMDRREDRLPEERLDAPGVGLLRNPGVACVWITASYETFRMRDTLRAEMPEALAGATLRTSGYLIRIGDPGELRWYAEGRKATRAEIEHSIETGLPSLRAAAELNCKKR